MSDYDSLKRSEKRTIEQALAMEGGYVLDFSNRTIEEHFEDEFGIEFYADRYSTNGDSKAKRLRSILQQHSGAKAAIILRNLWEVRATLPVYGETPDPKAESLLSEKFFEVLDKLNGGGSLYDMEAFVRFDDTHTSCASSVY